MKYSFKEIMNGEIYESTRVMFVLGKYSWFNNMVCDTLKYMSISDNEVNTNEIVDIASEFGMSTGVTEDDRVSNSVDFSTFMDVIGVANISGKWFCRTELSVLTKKQRDALMKYIKEPSENGILVIVSENWKDYRDILKSKILSFSKVSHIMQLSFPSRNIVKNLVSQSFSDKGITIDSAALDLFIMKMSSEYNKYEEQIENIAEIHKQPQLTAKDLKVYMKGIENFVVDDFVEELLKPMVSDKTNSKKVLKMMVMLQEELEPKNLVYQVLNKVEEYIEFRILINNGYIPVGINFFFNDIIKGLPEKEKEKYEKMNEWMFRKKVDIASRTSLKDWEYIKIFLYKAIENNKLPDEVINMKCQKALYEISTRSVITPDRVNNIIGVDNVLNKDRYSIDKIVFDDKALEKINKDIQLANES